MSTRLQRNYSAVGTAVTRAVQIEDRGGDAGLQGQLDGETLDVTARLVRRIPGGAEFLLGSGATAERVVVVRDENTVLVALRGRVHRLAAVTGRSSAPAAHDPGEEPFATSPMTGVVLDVKVAPGDVVPAGSTLFVVEAMKMEFVVEAPRDVVVDEVRAVTGGKVDIGEVVVTFVVAAETADESGDENDDGGDASV